jgi:putative NADPH-quinone reductase
MADNVFARSHGLPPNPDGFAPEVRAEMEKLFWWGIRALLSLTTGGPEETYAEGGRRTQSPAGFSS